jgi:hypothetical protein
MDAGLAASNVLTRQNRLKVIRINAASHAAKMV